MQDCRWGRGRRYKGDGEQRSPKPCRQKVRAKEPRAQSPALWGLANLRLPSNHEVFIPTTDRDPVRDFNKESLRPLGNTSEMGRRVAPETRGVNRSHLISILGYDWTLGTRDLAHGGGDRCHGQTVLVSFLRAQPIGICRLLARSGRAARGLRKCRGEFGPRFCRLGASGRGECGSRT